MMQLIVLCAVAALAGTFGTSWQSASRPPSPVVVDAVAFDKNGAPVSDLKPADLEVWIGHFRVPIESLELVTPESEGHAGRLVILLMDDITVRLPDMERARQVARRFVARLAPGDQMAVVMLSEPTLESSDDPARLGRAINRYNVRAGTIMRTDQLGTQVLQTVARLAGALTEAGDGRKVIVGIGSGWLFDRPIPAASVGADLLPEWIAAMRALSRSHAAFYAIDPGGLGATRSDGGDSGFARETGGRAFINTNDLNGAADRVLRETTSYYLIGTGNPPVGGNGLRELEVKSLRKGITIRARRAVH